MWSPKLKKAMAKTEHCSCSGFPALHRLGLAWEGSSSKGMPGLQLGLGARRPHSGTQRVPLWHRGPQHCTYKFLYLT